MGGDGGLHEGAGEGRLAATGLADDLGEAAAGEATAQEDMVERGQPREEGGGDRRGGREELDQLGEGEHSILEVVQEWGQKPE